ncbi:4Fe-4S dicluster domain-containing protein [Chloroflexota bacterium]
MTRLGIVIDLKRCVGCQTCMAACKVENLVPAGIYWNRVHDYELGEYPNVSRTFLPVSCMHCENPPCQDVCPTGATFKREDGIVLIDQDKCIGCGYCAVACPYQARMIYKKEKHYYEVAIPCEQLPDALRSPSQRHQVGVSSKCTFCAQRIDKALEKGLTIGVDPEATPACVNACIAKARYFGDLDYPNSEVSELLAGGRALRLLPELGTEPNVYFLT